MSRQPNAVRTPGVRRSVGALDGPIRTPEEGNERSSSSGVRSDQPGVRWFDEVKSWFLLVLALILLGDLVRVVELVRAWR